jgi:carbon-monoxide dehydrogenase small subunit
LKVTLTVNGRHVEVNAAPRLTLADVLRDRLSLTGTHLGCEQGVCGACTVLLDGQAVRSCLALAVQVDGQAVTTVEGLDAGTGLRDAFIRHRALQCGFCTPGMLASATALLNQGRRYDRAELRQLLSGNICRCTGYELIVEAVYECQ